MRPRNLILVALIMGGFAALATPAFAACNEASLKAQTRQRFMNDATTFSNCRDAGVDITRTWLGKKIYAVSLICDHKEFINKAEYDFVAVRAYAKFDYKTCTRLKKFGLEGSDVFEFKSIGERKEGRRIDDEQVENQRASRRGGRS